MISRIMIGLMRKNGRPLLDVWMGNLGQESGIFLLRDGFYFTLL